jgi:hypothetical protein
VAVAVQRIDPRHAAAWVHGAHRPRERRLARPEEVGVVAEVDVIVEAVGVGPDGVELAGVAGHVAGVAEVVGDRPLAHRERGRRPPRGVALLVGAVQEGVGDGAHRVRVSSGGDGVAAGDAHG